jgi:CheY-like chemotaxis protein
MSAAAKQTTKESDFLALVVDDQRSIREATKEYFQRHGLRAIVASSVKEALRHVKSTPALDVVITDVDLDPDPDANDTGGVTIAKEVRKIRAALPVLAYTAHKEQDFDAPVDWDVFDEPLGKGGGFKSIEQNLEKCLGHARRYREKRITSAKDELIRLQQKYEIADYDVATLRSFLPGAHDITDKRVEAGVGMLSADELLRRAGYELHLIEAGKPLGDEEVGNVVASVPVAVWVRKEGDSSYVAELYEHPCIYGEASTVEGAIGAVTMLMAGYHQDLQSSKDLGVELQHLKEYLNRVLSASHATKHERGS